MSSVSLPSARPRILHCVSHLALGGAERVAVSIISSLSDEFDFSLHAVRGIEGEVGLALERQLRDLGCPITRGPRIPMRFGGMVTGALGLDSAIRRGKPDVVHLHTEIPEASCATLLTYRPALRHLPLVRTIHNSVIWKFWPTLGRATDRRLAHARVTAVSEKSAAAFLALRAESQAASSAPPPLVIYNGVSSVPLSTPSRPSDGNVIRMVYGGRFEWEKGTDLLPAILARTRLPPGCRAHLTLFGSGRQLPLLLALEKNAPTGWSVECRPPIADFAAQLSRYDIALLPSRHEGLALVAIEALLAGIQVVATSAAGLQEALPPHHPWLAQPDDPADFAAKLSATCAQREGWPELAAHGQKFALERFNLTRMANGYRALYREILSRGGSRAG